MLLSEARVMPFVFVSHVSRVEDHHVHSMLSRGSHPRLMKARDSDVRGLRIGVGPERQ